MKPLTCTIVLAAFLLAGCSSAPKSADTSAVAQTAAASTSAPVRPSLKTFTHADLQAAAKYAGDHGYPARAAMWAAIEAQLTAAENQVAACKAAIDAALPKPSIDGIVGVAMLTEIGAEAVAQGIPASVKANCEPIVLPAGLLPLPRLP